MKEKRKGWLSRITAKVKKVTWTSEGQRDKQNEYDAKNEFCNFEN